MGFPIISLQEKSRLEMRGVTKLLGAESSRGHTSPLLVTLVLGSLNQMKNMSGIAFLILFLPTSKSLFLCIF